MLIFVAANDSGNLKDFPTGSTVCILSLRIFLSAWEDAQAHISRFTTFPRERDFPPLESSTFYYSLLADRLERVKIGDVDRLKSRAQVKSPETDSIIPCVRELFENMHLSIDIQTSQLETASIRWKRATRWPLERNSSSFVQTFAFVIGISKKVVSFSSYVSLLSFLFSKFQGSFILHFPFRSDLDRINRNRMNGKLLQRKNNDIDSKVIPSMIIES